MVDIIEIDIKEFEDKIYKKYIKLFPKEEQRDWEKIKNTYRKRIEKFYKITLNGTTIGFFMLEKIKEEYPYYLDYFAIFEQYQNKGYGTQAIKKLLDKIVINQGLAIEIEMEEESNPLTIKRANFYKNLGFRKVDSKYLLYNVLYTPYIYDGETHLNRDEINKIMFDYYKVNCGENEVKINCKFISESGVL